MHITTRGRVKCQRRAPCRSSTLHLSVQMKRWQLVGNAVSVAVARWLGERLAHPHRHKYILSAKDRCMDPGACPRTTQGRRLCQSVICHCMRLGGNAACWQAGLLEGEGACNLQLWPIKLCESIR